MWKSVLCSDFEYLYLPFIYGDNLSSLLTPCGLEGLDIWGDVHHKMYCRRSDSPAAVCRIDRVGCSRWGRTGEGLPDWGCHGPGSGKRRWQSDRTRRRVDWRWTVFFGNQWQTQKEVHTLLNHLVNFIENLWPDGAHSVIQTIQIIFSQYDCAKINCNFKNW